MNIIFQIDGGIGKSIMATAVCKAIKKQYPDAKLIVVTGYPEVFACNPLVHKALNFNTPYFYQDHIAGQEVKFLLHNPYHETGFLMRQQHCIATWCEMFGLAYEGEGPELYMNKIEYDLHAPAFASPKPILVLQTNGGGSQQKYSWARDIPAATAQQVVNAFANDYTIVHLRRKDQLALENVTPLESSLRAILVLLSMSSKRLLIDSFAQHATAAMQLPSVVCWVANVPQQFGYSIHANIISNPPNMRPDLRFAQYNEYNIGGDPTESPYASENDIFNPDLIIETVRNFNGPVPTMPPMPLEMNNEQTFGIAISTEQVDSFVRNLTEAETVETPAGTGACPEPSKANSNGTTKKSAAK
ncbi:MAG: hypothetical protein EBZ77_06205 [Chitinophagia bacterium]|nr:hypothetical protein [Chitinophagia bacterium]